MKYLCLGLIAEYANILRIISLVLLVNTLAGCSYRTGVIDDLLSKNQKYRAITIGSQNDKGKISLIIAREKRILYFEPFFYRDGAWSDFVGDHPERLWIDESAFFIGSFKSADLDKKYIRIVNDSGHDIRRITINASNTLIILEVTSGAILEVPFYWHYATDTLWLSSTIVFEDGEQYLEEFSFSEPRTISSLDLNILGKKTIRLTEKRE